MESKAEVSSTPYTPFTSTANQTPSNMAQANLEGFRGELKASSNKTACSGMALRRLSVGHIPLSLRNKVDGHKYPPNTQPDSPATICISPDHSLSSYLYLSLTQLVLQLKWLCIHLPPFALTATPTGKALLIPCCNGPLTGPQSPLLPLRPSSTMLPRTIFLTSLATSLPA